MTTVCTVSGILKDLQGNVLASTTVGFSRKGVVSQYGDTLIPYDVEVTSNGSGSVSFDIYPGNFTGIVSPVSGRVEAFTMAVPETASADLEDLIGGPSEDITTGLAQLRAGLAATDASLLAIASGNVAAGDWDASAGTFPSSSVLGTFYNVTVAGTVGGIAFAIADRLYPVLANASTSTYAANWSKGNVSNVLNASVGGVYFIANLGLNDTGATDVSSTIQALIGSAKEIIFPAGTFYVGLDLDSPVTIRGAGPGRTILTTVSETDGTTLLINENVTLMDMTVQGHPDSAASKTIDHTGAHKVTALNVEFTGTNHTPSGGVNAAGDYQLCTFHTTVQPKGLGALCHSAAAKFAYSRFTGARTVEAKDSKFYWCEIGDATTANAVHIPDGETANDGTANGFTGISEYYDCIITAAGTGITEGNAGHAKLRRTRVNAGLVTTGSAGLYARSSSTFDVEDCNITSLINGNAVSFAKTSAQDPNGIGLAGDSSFKRCRIYGANTSLAIPAISGASTIGEVVLTDCDIIGGDDEISPKTSTYYRHATEKFLDYTDAAVFTANDTTQKFRFKGTNMTVTVAGSDAAKTGCHLSHLDAQTDAAHPDGMVIQVRYGGVSSRFVTFARGTTDDGGSMYFTNDASTLQIGQQIAVQFKLFGTAWRQI